MPFTVEMDKQESFIRIVKNEREEMLYWSEEEWAEDPEVVYAIANAINLATTKPEEFEKLVLKINDQRNLYTITAPIILPGHADKRYEGLTWKQQEVGYRTIGGDKGDVRITGFTLDTDGTTSEPITILDGVVLRHFGKDDGERLTDEEAHELAQEIVNFSFASIGFEAVQ